MFGFFKTYKDIKKGINDPALLGQDLALDAIKAPIVLMTFFAVIFFGALFLLAFTHLLGGPFLFFKIVFWILIIPAIFVETVFWMFISRVKKMLDLARKNLKKKEGVIDAEVE